MTESLESLKTLRLMRDTMSDKERQELADFFAPPETRPAGVVRTPVATLTRTGEGIHTKYDVDIDLSVLQTMPRAPREYLRTIIGAQGPSAPTPEEGSNADILKRADAMLKALNAGNVIVSVDKMLGFRDSLVKVMEALDDTSSMDAVLKAFSDTFGPGIGARTWDDIPEEDEHADKVATEGASPEAPPLKFDPAFELSDADERMFRDLLEGRPVAMTQNDVVEAARHMRKRASKVALRRFFNLPADGELTKTLQEHMEFYEGLQLDTAPGETEQLQWLVIARDVLDYVSRNLHADATTHRYNTIGKEQGERQDSKKQRQRLQGATVAVPLFCLP